MDDEPQTTTIPGVVTIVEKDDRGQPYALIQSQPANVLGLGVFSELVRIPLTRARRGHLLLSGNVQTSGAFPGQYVAIEINVVGFVGAAPTRLYATALTNLFNLVAFGWEEPETYSSLAFEARQIVDGQPSFVSTGITLLTFTIAGTYWR